MALQFQKRPKFTHEKDCYMLMVFCYSDPIFVQGKKLLKTYLEGHGVADGKKDSEG